MKIIPVLQSSIVVILLASATAAIAEPWAAPGDTRLRSDLQLLDDAGAIDVPLTSWPLSWDDISRSLANVDGASLSETSWTAYDRLKRQAARETSVGEAGYRIAASAASDPRIIRSFEYTPREEGELSAGVSWVGNHFALNLNASLVSDPFDDDEIRPDGTYLGLSVGNWMLSAGWQERWWGPGRDGSLILSSNARPLPAFSIQRKSSKAFDSRWLSWIGPWSLAAFMGQLDDERVLNDALLFGLRINFKPLNGLEIGLSRTAQWCGDGRPCGFSAFSDLLVGNDNRGVNVDPEDEPGNQLAGLDIRYALPKNIPLALYMQWIGEDSRRGGPEIGSWLRQFGIEHWGTLGSLQHRTHVEVSDTKCREGGFGFSETKPDCGYEHSIYQTGYRYNGRSIAHGMDGDGLSYSLGSTLVQPGGHSWNLSLRYIEINRAGMPAARHTLSATPQELTDVQLTHDRATGFGRFHVGLGLSRLDDEVSGGSSEDIVAFVGWKLGNAAP
ncbi:MAG TPA: capsule assembly Wzi family protein [Woeseiaceae bacterium]|nr:capsule assembly Wzi family protein [Woeseiaceae bacterium]